MPISFTCVHAGAVNKMADVVTLEKKKALSLQFLLRVAQKNYR